MDPTIEARETAERALAKLLELKQLCVRISPTWRPSPARYGCHRVQSLRRTQLVWRLGWRSERSSGRWRVTIRAPVISADSGVRPSI